MSQLCFGPDLAGDSRDHVNCLNRTHTALAIRTCFLVYTQLHRTGWDAVTATQHLHQRQSGMLTGNNSVVCCLTAAPLYQMHTCRYQEAGERLAVENFSLADEVARQKLTLQDINEFLTNELKARSIAAAQASELVQEQMPGTSKPWLLPQTWSLACASSGADSCTALPWHMPCRYQLDTSW